MINGFPVALFQRLAEIAQTILEANKEAVLAAADKYAARMTEFRRALAAGDTAALVAWLTEAKQVRDALGS